jgi:hypothetical protein
MLFDPDGVKGTGSGEMTIPEQVTFFSSKN